MRLTAQNATAEEMGLASSEPLASENEAFAERRQELAALACTLTECSPDKSLKVADNVLDQLRSFREGWNRIKAIEVAPLFKSYLDGELEILAYGDWRGRRKDYKWLASILNARAIVHGRVPAPGVYPVYASECDCW